MFHLIKTMDHALFYINNTIITDVSFFNSVDTKWGGTRFYTGITIIRRCQAIVQDNFEEIYTMYTEIVSAVDTINESNTGIIKSNVVECIYLLLVDSILLLQKTGYIELTKYWFSKHIQYYNLCVIIGWCIRYPVLNNPQFQFVLNL